MKNILTGILLSTLTVSMAYAESITICSDKWLPVNGETMDEHAGYGLEIAEALFSKHNIEIHYNLMGWSKALKRTESGQCDAVIGATKAEAPNFVYPNSSLGNADSIIYVKKGNPWRYKSIDSLKEIRIGAMKDYSYEKQFDDYLEKNKKSDRVSLSTYDEGADRNLKLILLGKLDATIETSFVFDYLLKQHNVAGHMINAGEVGEKEAIYLAFSPVHPRSSEYSKMFDEGVQALKTSGELKKILDKYGVQPWSP